jgi:hypothetical protein
MSALVQTTPPKGTPPNLGGEKVTLVARNAESFSFLYQETLDYWVDKRFFDPEKDVPDFNGIDLLYLPGGYPEKHLEALALNEACRKAIKDYAEQGGRIIAECGGMMYLCERIVTDEGDYPMCGVLPYSITARKADRRLSLGYRRFELDGKEYRGHEFHYTQFMSGEGQKMRGERLPSATQVYNAKGEPVSTPVFKYKNVLASYTHLYDWFTVYSLQFTDDYSDGSEGLASKSTVNCKPSTVNYFPAYEIVNDELRDYRFYASDMLHPSQQAVDYIWERLVETYFSRESKAFLEEWRPLKQALGHKPFNPNSEAYKSLMDKTMLKMQELREKYPTFAL